jgi:hypothetical protein
MSTHRCSADDVSPAPAALACPANTADDATAPAGCGPEAAVEPKTCGARRAIQRAFVAGCASIAGSAAGWVLGGPALAIAGVLALIAASLIGAVVAAALSALLDRRDSRSPFDRLMLILCVVLGRSPGTYLPPTVRQEISATSEIPGSNCPAGVPAPIPRESAK